MSHAEVLVELARQVRGGTLEMLDAAKADSRAFGLDVNQAMASIASLSHSFRMMSRSFSKAAAIDMQSEGFADNT